MAMPAIAAAVATATAIVLLTAPAPTRIRLARILPAQKPGDISHGTPPPGGPDGFLGSPQARATAAVLVAVGCAVLIGGGAGLIVAIPAGAGAWVGLGRLEPASRVREREKSAAMLPLAIDLLAAAVAAGCPPVNAVDQVGRALGGPLGRSLTAAASAARLAPHPADVWSAIRDDPTLRPLARTLTAATTRGTSPVPALQRSAHEARETARWAAETRARAVGARAAAPLGLCFLPAFILLAIVPVVATSGLTLL